MALTFRKCTPADLDTLVQISRETFSEAFEKDNDPEDFKTYLQKAFAPGQLATELQNPNCLFHFVFEDETLVGYFKLNMGAAQTDVHDPNALELERIYVLAEHQGKQIGAWMLDQIAILARNMDKTYIWLGVWEHNPNAIRFYQRYGFQKFGEHPYYIGTDRQTDWLMRLDVQ